MHSLHILLIFFVGLHLLIATLLTKELICWPKITAYGRIMHIIFVWLVPLVGVLLAYKRVKLDWFKSQKSRSESIGCGFLEMDSFFNPGAKNAIDAKDKFDVGIVQSIDDSEIKKLHSLVSIEDIKKLSKE